MLNALIAIALREYLAFFRTASGWIIIAMFLLLTGYAFAAQSLVAGAPATMRPLFSTGQWLLLLVAPAVSMRLVAEESRSGTLEALSATPIGDGQLVLGKFLGAALFLVTMITPAGVFWISLETLSDPEPGPALTGVLGLVLLGSLYLSAGLNFSVLTKSQPVAFLLTVAFFFGWHLAATHGASNLGSPWDRVAFGLSISERLQDFAKGVIDTGHLVFFGVSTGFFLILAAVVLESRRWR